MCRPPARPTDRSRATVPHPRTRSAPARAARRGGGARRLAALLGSALALAACGDGDGPGVTGPEAAYAGTYAVTRQNQAAACAPAPLPAPAASPEDADEVGYADLAGPPPPPWAGRFLRASFAGPEMFLEAYDEHGTRQGEVFRGTVAGDGTFSAAETREGGTEGPREGGHMFTVQQKWVVSGAFDRSSGQTRLDATASLTYDFRDGIVDGPLFTTCVVPFTIAGVRGAA